MELKRAEEIVENMCFRYGKPEENGRTKQQVEEITALNIVLNKAMGMKLEYKRWLD